MIRDNELEIAIGRQIRTFRFKAGLNVAQLAEQAELSPAMLSKIERGVASPSLSSIKALAAALDVPVQTFFQLGEHEKAVHTPAGKGEREETLSDFGAVAMESLGRLYRKGITFRPYIVTTWKVKADAQLMQQPGVQFIYVLEGTWIFEHADQTYSMRPGDSILYETDAPHRVASIETAPVRTLTLQAAFRSASIE